MDIYYSFAAIALAVVYMPGPGTIKSINNAINFGFYGSVIGISGLTLGVCAVAVLSASGLGLLLMSSPQAFRFISYFGAAYLLRLAFKMWFTEITPQGGTQTDAFQKRSVFSEGFLLQFSNPNAILFFCSVFPHFVDAKESYITQFSMLVTIFCLAFICAHASYALLAYKARTLFTEHSKVWINRINAILYLLLSSYLIYAA
ncbi:LysE family translocator [Vibrio sp. SCSIO 43137]|uniref:LysE family translocator n=1 Tax=Vibrio sp. SCSIO 43137 TaxID=3021011 RepID=UPI0023076627|nr:LysE family translocator [Vibrio sp. SCSIO 43137]WCE28756.1 LysE family translocator [Vibrio sp. SCSIO 43137]